MDKNLMDLSDYFNVYVLTLKSWPARRQRFSERAAELGVTGFTFVEGFDGDLITPPNWWAKDPRTWACAVAHSNALNYGIMTGNGRPIVIIEDDAYLKDNFVEAVSEVVAYFRDYPGSTICFLGGKVHWDGTEVSRLIRRDHQIGGGYGYVVSAQHAGKVSGYMLDDPAYNGAKPSRYGYACDTKMMQRAKIDRHAVCHPVCVGHHGGPSVILKRNRKPLHID